MFACLTRKRSRPEDDEDDLPHAKREPDQYGSEGGKGAAGSTSDGLMQADGDARDRQVLEQDEELWF